MSQPDYRPLNTGDNADDDPGVLDSLVQSNPTPPPPPVEAIQSPVLTPPPIPTRLLSNRTLIDPLWQSPALILPEDIRRKYFVVRVRSSVTDPGPNLSDGIIVRSDVGSTLGLGVLYHDEKLELPFHTGAVFCLAVGNAPVYVDVWSVTV